MLGQFIFQTGAALSAVETSDTEVLPVYELEDYYVRVLHFEQDILDVPADSVLISREVIESNAYGSVPDLLAVEANVGFRSVNGKKNGSEAALRGFGEGSGLRVLVLVDGIKVNRADMSSVEWQLLPLRDIESIEVLRGGHGVLYGNHALSGVIKITTRKGGEPRSSVAAFGGSNGYENYDVSNAGGLGDFFYRVNADYNYDEGYRDNSLSWAKGAQVSFGYYLNESNELSTKLSYREGFQEFPGPLILEQLRQDPTQSQSPNQSSESENYQQTISWFGEHDWGEFEVHGGYYKRDLVFSLDGIFGDNQQDGFSFTPKVKIGDSTDFITAGFDLLYDTIAFTDFTTEGREYVAAEADLTRWTTGCYLFAQKGITDQLSLNGGVRYERAETNYEYLKYDESQLEPFDPIFGNPFNPNPNFKNPADVIPAESFSDELKKEGWAAELSLNFRVNKKLSLWVGYDRVYRYPVLDEVAAYQGFPLSEPLNQDLNPEQGDNFEIGVKRRGQSWSFATTVFYMHLENEIAFDDLLNLNTNIGATNRFGADFSLSYEKANYGASTQWTVVEATYDGGLFDGNRLPLVPGVNGVTQVWVEPMPDWRASMVLTYTAERYVGNDDANQERQLSSYTLCDLQLTHDVSEHIKLFARVNNVFDRQYASTAFVGGLYPGAGRSLVAGLTAEF